MLVRGGRLVPLASRYGAIIFAALLVWYVVRLPATERFLGEHLHADGPGDDQSHLPNGVSASAGDHGALSPEPPQQRPPTKTFKKPAERFRPIKDPFPWLTQHNKAPPITKNNVPPEPHVDEHTPLFIGFTRNWPMLLQCMCSYIAAGWPPEDIYIVENTGTFRSNKEGELSLQNPFFLNHTQLRILGVHVLMTPTLLSFAQLQNFYLYTALQRGWQHFFWSHQDVLVFSDEEVRKKDRDHDHDHDPYATIYERAVGLLRYLEGPEMPQWSTHFFAYDHLTLVHRDAYLDVGAWDPLIPYYASDCDMYLRLHWAGYWQPQSEAGLIFDVATPLEDVGALFRLPGAHASFQGYNELKEMMMEKPGAEVELQQEKDLRSWVEKEGETYQHLVQVAGRMQEAKWVGKGAWRNSWQSRQSGGEGEPFYRSPEGFETALQTLIDAGRRNFADKWGHRGCNLLELGYDGTEAWKLERDWDINDGPGSLGGDWGKDWMGA